MITNDYDCFLLEDSAWDRAASPDGKLGVKVNFDNIYMDSVKPWTLHIIAYNLYQDQKYAYLNEQKMARLEYANNLSFDEIIEAMNMGSLKLDWEVLDYKMIQIYYFYD